MAQVHAAGDAADAEIIAAWLRSNRPTVVAPGAAAGLSGVEALFYAAPPPEPEWFATRRARGVKQAAKRARPRKLAVTDDPAKVRIVRRMWREGKSLASIGAAIGITAAGVKDVAKRLELPSRGHDWRDRGK